MQFERQAVKGGEEAHHHLAAVAVGRIIMVGSSGDARDTATRRAPGKIVRSCLRFGLRNSGRGDVIFDSIECGVKFAASRDIFFYICGCVVWKLACRRGQWPFHGAAGRSRVLNMSKRLHELTR